jgi:hypothetical protein
MVYLDIGLYPTSQAYDLILQTLRFADKQSHRVGDLSFIRPAGN